MMVFLNKSIYFCAPVFIIFIVGLVLVSGHDLETRNGSDYDELQNMSTTLWNTTQKVVHHCIINNFTIASYNSEEYDCGGVLTKSQDTFDASVCPATNYSCIWIICDESRGFTHLRPVKFKLKNNENCEDEYVETCEGCKLSENGSILAGKRARYCGQGETPELISQNQIIVIVLKVYSLRRDQHDDYCENRIRVIAGQYMFFNYNPTCGGTQMGENGVLMSPGYPVSHFNDEYRDLCLWEITAPIGRLIHFTVVDGIFGKPDLCVSFKYFEMSDGAYSPNHSFKLFNKTNPLPSSFTSNSNSVQFKLVTCHKYFKLKIIWRAIIPPCNVTMNTSSGVVTSPNFPNVLYSSANCWWKLNVNPGNTIRFIFVNWVSLATNIEPCNRFYLSIIDGKNETGSSIGKWCLLDDYPPIVETSTNSAAVLLNSFSNGQVLIGFRLLFETVCTSILKGFHGTIESINFPYMYPPNVKCSWTIESGNNIKLLLNFTHFNLQTAVMRQDFLPIVENQYNGCDSEIWNTIGKFTGRDPAPTIIIAKGTKVQINFQSFNKLSRSANGFRLEWRLEGCRSEIYKSHDVVHSPNYPNLYPHNSDCKWKIVTSSGTRVAFIVHTFDIENSTNCNFDGLKIFSESVDGYNLLANICGRGGSTISLISDYNRLHIEFYSDSTIVSTGFNASFSEVEMSCGGKFNGSAGYIYSAHYPNSYNNIDDCTWLITVDPNYKSAIKLIEYEIQWKEDCGSDNLTMFDGSTIDTKLRLGLYCGTSNSTENSVPVIMGSRNLIMVRFLTDQYATNKGFKAKYFQTCGAILRRKSGIIKNPDYMSIMNGAGNCSWKIEATDRKSLIVIVFTNFSWPVTDPFCAKHNIMVYDGDNEKNFALPELYMGCCNHIPPPLLSSGNAVTLQIRNAEELKFQAFYFILPKGCVNSSGSPSDPLHKLTESINARCNTILTSDNHQIFVSLQQYETSSDNRSCNKNYVEVYSNNYMDTMIGHYCGSEIPSLVEKFEYWIIYLKWGNEIPHERIERNFKMHSESALEPYNNRGTDCDTMQQYRVLFTTLTVLFNSYVKIIE